MILIWQVSTRVFPHHFPVSGIELPLEGWFCVPENLAWSIDGYAFTESAPRLIRKHLCRKSQSGKFSIKHFRNIARLGAQKSASEAAARLDAGQTRKSLSRALSGSSQNPEINTFFEVSGSGHASSLSAVSCAFLLARPVPSRHFPQRSCRIKSQFINIDLSPRSRKFPRINRPRSIKWISKFSGMQSRNSSILKLRRSIYPLPETIRSFRLDYIGQSCSSYVLIRNLWSRL